MVERRASLRELSAASVRRRSKLALHHLKSGLLGRDSTTTDSNRLYVAAAPRRVPRLGTEIFRAVAEKGAPMNPVLDVVVVSSDLETSRQLKLILNAIGMDAFCLCGIRDCQTILADHDVDLVFCDSSLADGSYRDLLRMAELTDRAAKVVVTSRQAGWEE